MRSRLASRGGAHSAVRLEDRGHEPVRDKLTSRSMAHWPGDSWSSAYSRTGAGCGSGAITRVAEAEFAFRMAV
jgi:hypothetical protein